MEWNPLDGESECAEKIAANADREGEREGGFVRGRGGSHPHVKLRHTHRVDGWLLACISHVTRE